ncbi:putative surface protease GP63 [Trypanosoma cruzi]|uniref:Leishmanolysin-like peptidase n=2 Tax=Trypanosoma cruzi TaxID=5693 RepID=Q4D8S9_TRYCC|nr:surface protease GP63, putative [Trypanosoma cruzi]EAN88927.1 surface protease GP63, putative [Trypanosoma cruzi]PWV21082.1 putative surface protease GP63 [Trypanosoma cruzi]|eukprot:XP_810778.1 surface protease GP63 [Trypanosoma cruzi strain CL Brener]
MHLFHAIRPPRHTALPLRLWLVVLLLMYCASGCIVAAPTTQYRCGFDVIMRRSGPLPTAVVRGVPRRGQGAVQAYTVAADDANNGWESLRIMVSVEDLENETKHCTKVGETKPDFAGRDRECTADDILTEEKKRTLLDEVIPVAVNLHAERLLVQRINVRWVMPGFGERSRCRYFTVPPSHRGVGILGADTVLYVAAGTGSEVWAVPCAAWQDLRPVAVAMQFTPKFVMLNMHASRTAAHFITHALGFSVREMARRNMLLAVDGVRGSPTPVAVVNYTATLEEAKKHYRCGSIKGMELQMGPGGLPESHWPMRNAKDELMCPLGENFAGRYTELTMITLEGLGYYKTVPGMGEPMDWGKNAGCDFLNKQCSAESPVTYPGMFCNEEDKSLRCSSDRQTIGPCFISVGDGHAEPPETCPIFFPALVNETPLGAICTLEGSGNPPGSLLGIGSWCLDGDSLEAKTAVGGKWQANVVAVCARVLCRHDGVFVKYLGGNFFELCPAGQSITPKSRYFRGGGKIICPKYEEVCTIAANGSSRVLLIPTDGSDARATAALGHFILTVLAAIAAVVVVPV